MRIARTRVAKPVEPEEVIMGLDASLTSTGVCYRAGAEELVLTLKTKDKGPLRLRFLRNAVRQLVQEQGVTLVIYEGYSMRSKGKVFNIGELGGVLQVELWEQGVDVLVVPPTTLKQAATGKGNADKPAMLAAAQETFGVTITQDDEVDAFWLMMFGEALRFGTGPSQFVKRVKAAEAKVILQPGRKIRVQSIARK